MDCVFDTDLDFIMDIELEPVLATDEMIEEILEMIADWDNEIFDYYS